jgi:hypothetical protein
MGEIENKKSSTLKLETCGDVENGSKELPPQILVEDKAQARIRRRVCPSLIFVSNPALNVSASSTCEYFPLSVLSMSCHISIVEISGTQKRPD